MGDSFISVNSVLSNMLQRIKYVGETPILGDWMYINKKGEYRKYKGDRVNRMKQCYGIVVKTPEESEKMVEVFLPIEQSMLFHNRIG